MSDESEISNLRSEISDPQRPDPLSFFPNSQTKGIVAISICAILLILSAIISYTASEQKSANYDEPLHLVAGYIHHNVGDFRINPEDPALFGYLAVLPLARGQMNLMF